jgi:DNA-binding response OmpR family regulator
MRAILLVDQKPVTACLMKTYLEVDGYEVDHTPDPEEAIEFASHTRYGVVITDLVMRGRGVDNTGDAGCCSGEASGGAAKVMSGLDLYREIRYYDAHARFVFMLTLSSEALRLLGSLDRGDVIKKEPLSMNEVISKVRAAFDSSYTITNSR